jgi:hypothetical protein
MLRDCVIYHHSVPWSPELAITEEGPQPFSEQLASTTIQPLCRTLCSLHTLLATVVLQAMQRGEETILAHLHF